MMTAAIVLRCFKESPPSYFKNAHAAQTKVECDPEQARRGKPLARELELGSTSFSHDGRPLECGKILRILSKDTRHRRAANGLRKTLNPSNSLQIACRF